MPILWLLDLRNAVSSQDAAALAGLLAEHTARSPDPKRVDHLAAQFLKAARNGATDCLTLLLPHCDAQARDESGATALMLAAEGGHTDCVRALIPVSDPKAIIPCDDPSAPQPAGKAPAGARSAWGPQEKQTALILAARHGHARCVELLLPVSDARAQDDTGLTAIGHAMKRWSAECADLLALHSDPYHADAALRQFGAAAMPRYFSRQEAAELRAEIGCVDTLEQGSTSEGEAIATPAPTRGRRILKA